MDGKKNSVWERNRRNNKQGSSLLTFLKLQTLEKDLVYRPVFQMFTKASSFHKNNSTSTRISGKIWRLDTFCKQTNAKNFDHVTS